MRGRSWSQSEDRILEEIYGKMPLEKMVDYFKGRTLSSIFNRAYILRLTRKIERKVEPMRNAPTMDHPLLNWKPYRKSL